jgi:hypothetical protein
MQSETGMTSWLIHTMGRLEAIGTETHRRIDDMRETMRSDLEFVRRELTGRIVRLEKKRSGRFPWAQIAAMGTVAITSLLGLLSPEKAVAILQAIAR